MGKEGGPTTLARIRNQVVGVLAERVEVETVEEQTHGIVLIRTRLPEGITEHERLAIEEWVQLQLIALEGGPDGLVYVPRYI